MPFPLYFFSVLCNSPLSGLNPYSDVQAVIYAPVRARWELTQTPSFMFGLFFAIFFVFVFPYFRANGVAQSKGKGMLKK